MRSKNYIKASLALSLDDLTSTLFPDKTVTKKGKQYRVGSKGSLSISASGFHSFEDDEKGDLIALVQYAHNCDFKEALRWCEAFLGISGNGEYIAQKSPEKTPIFHAPLRRKGDEVKRIEKALQIWNYSKSSNNTLAHEYLQKRGIKITPPASIRFNPSVYHFELKQNLPALVAGIQDANGKIKAVQATFIDADTKGKIITSTPKLCFGSVKGGAIRLSTIQEEVIISEGLEDGLTILQESQSTCVWCGVGANLANVKFPKTVKRIIIASDNDDAGDKFTQKLAERLLQEGRKVSEARPPKSCKDFNQLLTQNNEVNHDQ